MNKETASVYFTIRVYVRSYQRRISYQQRILITAEETEKLRLVLENKITMAALKDYIKVYFVDDVNHRIGYCASHKNWDKFKDAIQATLPGTNFDDFRIYWIDDEDEQIEIIDNQALDIFWLGSEGKKKIFVEKRAVEPLPKAKNVFIPTTEEHDEGDRGNQSQFPVHPNVICDGCNRQVRGYRYKCVQCPDFDLCMTCEAKMKHKEHVMFRIPAPLDKIRFDRRTLKEMKRGKFGSMEYERTADNRHHHTHEKRGKKHRVSGCNMATHLYNMMNDLAEGTEVPIEIPIDIEIRTNDQSENTEPKTTREPNPERTRTSPPTVSVLPPNLENFLHQPMNYLNAGMEMLNLFNQMFANMSGPTNGKGTPNATARNEEPSAPSPTTEETQPEQCSGETDKQSSGETDKQSNGETEMFNDDVNTELSKGAVPKVRTTPEKETSMDNKNDGKEVDIHNEKELKEVSSNTDNKKVETILVNQPENGDDSKSVEKENDPRKSPSLETDWTVIDKQNEDLQSPEQRRKSEEKSLSETDYIKLSQDLKKHMEAETCANSEKRAKIVYHQKPHINEAVISMISMGFSNDGKYLTNLLETVDGDISAALELLNHENN